MRTIIYVDGFNLYYSALKGTPFKWLDLKTAFQNLLGPHHTIVKIKYFTALVSGRVDPGQPIRQQTYIRALESYTPEFEPIYGHFLSHVVWARLANPQKGAKQYVQIFKTEEKGSDVKLAVHLLHDAWLNNYECAIVVSNDSDLSEAMQIIKAHHRKTVGLICPNDGVRPSRELMKNAHFVKKLRKGVLSISQLPDPIPSTTISKPASW